MSKNDKIEQYIKYPQTYSLKVIGWRWCDNLLKL